MRLRVLWSVMGGALAVGASIPVPQPVTLNGRPFPPVAPYVVRVAAHTLSVEPKDDVQRALCELKAGDQLRFKPGKYTASYSIDEKCADGPIAVVFDAHAIITGSITIRRSGWIIDHAHIQDGSVQIAAGAQDVTISNSRIAGADVGIDVAPGARHIVIANNHIYNNAVESIRVRGAREVEIVGNTIRDAVAIESGDSVQIRNNTIEEAQGETRTRGIVLERVDHVTVTSNHILNAGVAVAIGRVEANGSAPVAANDVTIDHNHIENTMSTGVAVGIEAGDRVLFANNVVEGYANGILVLGKSSEVKRVTIANNLVLGVTATAFAIRDPSALRLFDFNVFSPTADAVKVEVGTETLALARFLERRTMPQTRLVPGVHLLQRDLGRVAGVETVDRGTRVGLAFKGRAPDLGVSER